MQVTWDDGSVGDFTGEAQATPQTVTWDDGTTSDYEAPTDEVLTDIPAVGTGVTSEAGVYSNIEEEGGQTASPQDIQLEKDRMTVQDMGKDIEEVRTATSSAWDNIKQTFSDDKAINKAIEKRDSKTSKMLLDKYGARVEKRGKGKVLVFTNDDGTTRAIDYPEEGNLLDVIASARREGEYAVAGAAMGAGLGAMTGPAAPIASPVLAAVGGGIGAFVGAGADVERGAERQGIEVTEEEKSRLQRHAGITDVAAGVVLGGLAKLFQPKALENFTSLADMPKKYRKAVQVLQDESHLSDEQMEKAIRSYADITEEGVISQQKAVEAGAKATETEQVGFADKAMKLDTKAKAGSIEESTKRSNIVGEALADDEEALALYARRTMDDKGRRKSTNWAGLESDLRNLGYEKGDEVYDMVASNAKVFGTKETDLFQSTVRPANPQEKPFIKGVTDTARGSVATQLMATKITFAEKVINKFGMGAEAKTYSIIQEAMKEGVEPKKLTAQLVNTGMERRQAKEMADELVKAEIQATKEAETSLGKKGKEFEKVIKQEEKAGSAIESGIKKDVAEFKKTKVVMQKEKKAEDVSNLKIMKESMRRAGVDWDEANIDKSVSTKDKARLREARRRAQVDATTDLGDTDSDVAVAKIQKEILDKKGKGTLKPSAMTAGIRRKQTPNQIEADKVRDINPDDKEAIKKALFAKSPEVQAKKAAEEGLARERSLDLRTDAEIKANDAVEKALANGVDLYDTKPLYKKTMVKETIPKKAKLFYTWMDENPTKEFLHFAKEKNLTTKEVKAYYDGLGKEVPKSWVESTSKVEPKAMKVGIKKPNLKEKHFKDITIPTKVGVSKSWERNNDITDKMVVEYYKEAGKEIPQSIINSSRRLWKGE